jgi:hypothetical protein
MTPLDDGADVRPLTGECGQDAARAPYRLGRKTDAAGPALVGLLQDGSRFPVGRWLVPCFVIGLALWALVIRQIVGFLGP